MLSEHLISNLLVLSSPDDLFNFFDKLRGRNHISCNFLLIYLCLHTCVLTCKHTYFLWFFRCHENYCQFWSGVLAAPEGSSMEEEQTLLDPNSHLGIFIRCCILTFNMLPFEVFRDVHHCVVYLSFLMCLHFSVVISLVIPYLLSF